MSASSKHTRPSLLAFALLSAGTLGAGAQAFQTASQLVRVEPYALASYSNPAFADAPAALAMTAGVNVDGVHVLPALEVGLDLRGTSARSKELNEVSLTAGPRLTYRRGWLQPYAEYLFGLGRGTFNKSTNPDYQHDFSAIRSYGGGVDVRATRNVTLRADAQYQRWRFTSLAPYFHPIQVSIGVAYHLHLRSHTGPQF